jgi:hypothetical protein
MIFGILVKYRFFDSFNFILRELTNYLLELVPKLLTKALIFGLEALVSLAIGSVPEVVCFAVLDKPINSPIN